MVKEKKYGQMVLIIKECIIKDKSMAKVNLPGQMVHIIKENFTIII